MRTQRPHTDRTTAVIEAVTERAADALAWRVRLAQMRRREKHPLARLGLDIIISAQSEIIESHTSAALERLTHAVAPDWWWTPAVKARSGIGLTGHVVAAEGRLVWVQADNSWHGQADDADLAARSLQDLASPRAMQATSIVCVAGEGFEPRSVVASSGRRVGIAPAERLADMVYSDLEGFGSYNPDAHPRLSRRLYGAQRAASQSAGAMLNLATELDHRRWVVAHGLRLRGLDWPISVIAAGPTGIYICEPHGIDHYRAATAALEGAWHLAQISDGLDLDVVPVVLCDPHENPHQLLVDGEQRVWALPLHQAAGLIEHADRRGLRPSQIRRIRRPAPGWEYRVDVTEDGWAFEISYDFEVHDRGNPRL
jgi:hypothetical protein